MKKHVKNVDLLHISFEIALILKALNSLCEIIGGILLAFLTPEAMNHVISILTQSELTEDPRDLIANSLLRMSGSFSISSQHFGMFYLLSHGISKMILVVLLWKGKLWAYPLSVVLLLIFILYQVYRYMVTPSVMMVLLTVLDLIVVLLTLKEYKKRKGASIA